MKAVRVAAIVVALVVTLTTAAGASAAGLLDNLLSPLTPAAGTSQAQKATSGASAGAGAAAASASNAVTGFQATVQPSIATAITKLQTRVQDTTVHAQALDGTALGADAAGALADVQASAADEVATLTGVALTQGLTNGLSIAQQVMSPVCSLLATPTALAQGVGVDLTRYTPLAQAIGSTDATTNALVRSTYDQLYDQILGSVNGQLGPGGAAAQAILTLLKYNWTTKYYPPNGGAPVVQTTKALLDVPTPIDVDGSGGFDLCATTTLAIDPTGKVKLSQQIAKLPLAKPVLPVDISGALLGVIGFGYETKDSTAPTNFTSDISVGSDPLLKLDNTYTVHRGQNLTLPLDIGAPTTIPLGLAAPLDQVTLPLVGALTTPAPTPKITQVMSVGGSAVAFRFRHENEPDATSSTLNLTGGLKVGYTGSDRSDLFSFSTAVGTVGLSVSAKPAGTSFSGCVTGLLGAGGGCSTATDTTGNLTSLRFTSSEPTKFDLAQTLVAASGTSPCPSIPLMDAHLTGRGVAVGLTPGTTAASSGKLWVDSADQPVSGCFSIGNAATGVGATLPDGFKAKQRAIAFHTTKTLGFTTGAVPDAKAGTIACPTGTTFSGVENAVLSFPLTPSVCVFPPVNTAPPTVGGQVLLDATVTAANGTWTPAAPNAPTFTYQWSSCNATGASCTTIDGATSQSLVLSDPALLGRTLKVAVTGTNLDGSATATSAASPAVALPPAPVNVTKPVVSAVTPPAGVGRPLRTTNGTWNNGVKTYTYTWLRCEEDGTGCAPITDAPNAATYTPVADDKGRVVTVRVKASNVGGDAEATASGGQFIPPAPINLTAAKVFNGASDATGQEVLTGDALTAKNGTWKYATSFAYDWQRCDVAGGGCASVNARLSSYTAAQADIGSTLRVKVTATNVDGSTDSISAVTGVVALNDLEVKAPASVVDGQVNAVAPSDHGTTFVGGLFDTVGTPTGGAGTVPSGGTAIPAAADGSHAVGGAARTEGGTVKAVVSDGAGGYFAGGSFTRAQGVPCVGLAHIKAGGTLDARYCQPNLIGEVRAVDFAKGLVAVGGAFTLGDHKNLAFFKFDGTDPAQGTETTNGTVVYAPDSDPNAAVNAITNDSAASGTSFYVGGDFTAVGAQLVNRLAKYTVDAAGAITRAGWTTGVDKLDGSPSTVKALGFIQVKSALGTYPALVVGGSFDRSLAPVLFGSGAVARNNAAMVSTSSAGTTFAWNPNADGPITAIGIPVAVLANNAQGAIYLGGDFTKLGTTAVSKVAEFGTSTTGGNNSAGTTATSSPSTSWKPALDNGTVRAIAFDAVLPTVVHVGGTFTSVGGVTRHRVAAFKVASATAVTVAEPWDPNAGQAVNALARVGNSIAIGGDFSVLGGVTRNNLAELDGSRQVTAWDPNVSGEVRALAPAAGGVYVGGIFGKVGTASRSNAASVQNDGTAGGWNPGVDGPVNALATDASGVYLGGEFTTAGGQPRANLAKVAGDGSTTPWNPGADGAVRALAARPGVVYAGGEFTHAGGAARGALAKLDATTGTAVAGWTADATGAGGAGVRAIAVAGGTVYVGGAFDHLGGQGRANAGAVAEADGAVSDFAPEADNTVRAVLPRGSGVFLGGDFTHLGGAARTFAGLVANDTGGVRSFTPEPDAAVRAIGVAPGNGLVLAGGFDSVAGKLSSGFAVFGGS